MKRGRAKKKPSGKNRDRPKKKALSGPPGSAAKKRAKRRGIVAARKRRRESLGARARKWSRRIDRRVDRLLTQAEPALVRRGHQARLAGARWSKRLLRWGRPLYVGSGRLIRWIGRRLRPLGIVFLRLLNRADRRTRRILAWAVRASTRASRTLTPERGLAVLIVAASASLLCAQFVDYRGVEVGQPGYAGIDAIAQAPTVGLETPTDAHSYFLVPVALLGIAIGLFVLTRGRRQLGRIAFGLGVLTVAVVLLVDMPAGLDLSGQASRFAGATAVLSDGFYAQLAAAAGMMIGGLLLAYAPTTRPARASSGKKVKGKAAINDSSSKKRKLGRKPRPEKTGPKRARKARLARTQGGSTRERTSGA